jgi:TRAP-type C4-dicarboxylate transport system substrate-binding protein
MACSVGRVVAAGAVLVALATAPAFAEDLPKQAFKVVGTWGNLTNYQKVEKPFWEKVGKDSNGAVTVDLKPQTELGLKGQEIMRMTRLGLFHFAHAIPIYVAEDAVLEGIDLAGVASSFAEARKMTEAYAPIFNEGLKKNYNAKTMYFYPFPAQMIYCKEPINSLADLKGRKVRVQGASQGDLVEALGGTSVTIAFAETVPSLERGVVNCGITGTMPAYKGGWHEVVDYVFELPLGFTITFMAANLDAWNKLDPKTQAFMTEEAKGWEDTAWKVIEDENEMGLICISGDGGTCTEGKAADVKRVKPTDADRKLLQKVLNEVVLKRWAARCGAECAKKWNETVGKATGLTASAG